MTVDEKLQDIIMTMLEEGMLDYETALHDTDYLMDRIDSYLKARKLALETLRSI